MRADAAREGGELPRLGPQHFRSRIASHPDIEAGEPFERGELGHPAHQQAVGRVGGEAHVVRAREAIAATVGDQPARHCHDRFARAQAHQPHRAAPLPFANGAAQGFGRGTLASGPAFEREESGQPRLAVMRA